jgi:hypothetical protein
MDTEKFGLAMNAYTIGQHQDILTYLITLKQVGYTIEDTEIYLKEVRKEITTQVKLDKGVQMACPECPATMFVYAVNTSRGDKTGDLTDKSVWLCQNPECMHTIYNKETIEELSQRGK